MQSCALIAPVAQQGRPGRKGGEDGEDGEEKPDEIPGEREMKWAAGSPDPSALSVLSACFVYSAAALSSYAGFTGGIMGSSG